MADIRKSFHEAVLDPEKSEDFHQYLADFTISDPTFKAYQAVSEAMLAQVVWNPFTKLSQVRKYERLMKVAVESDAENIEIRFLSLAIEYNLPRFLGMSKHLVEDRDVIVNNISSIQSMKLDRSFSRYILYFLNETDLCTQDQITQMEESLEYKSD